MLKTGRFAAKFTGGINRGYIFDLMKRAKITERIAPHHISAMTASQNALENFVGQAISLAAAGQLAAGAELVRNALRHGTLRKNAAHLDNVLESLDPQQHGLAYAAVLGFKLHQLADASNDAQAKEQFAALAEKAALLAAQIDTDQAHAAPDIFASVYRTLADVSLRLEQCQIVLPALLAALRKLRQHENQLTSIHASALCVTLKLRVFDDCGVKEVLDSDVNDILQEDSQKAQNLPAMDAKYALLYFYYGGMIYAALHNFDRAAFFFELALSVPANVISSIMVESYRKLVLVALIARGSAANVARVCRPPLLRRIQARCTEYVNLAKSVESQFKDAPCKAASVAQQHASVFEQHNNMGLVKLVLESVNRRSVTSLTQTYVTVTLADVVSKCHFQDEHQAETYINKMVSEGAIQAHLDRATGVVTFDESHTDAQGAAASVQGAQRGHEQMVAEQLKLAMATKQLMGQLNKQLLLNPTFVRRACKHSRKSGNVSAAGGPQILSGAADARSRFFEELADSDVTGLGV